MELLDRPAYMTRAREMLANFPVLAILGPRQCGKTTFAKNGFPDYEYLDLELPSGFQKLESDPELFLKSRRGPLIIALEIKSALSCRRSELESLKKAISLIGATKGYVITLGDDRYPLSDRVEALGIHRWIEEGMPPLW